MNFSGCFYKERTVLIFPDVYIDQPFMVLTGFDCLTKTDGGADFSSDLVCRGGIGGGGRRLVTFISESATKNNPSSHSDQPKRSFADRYRSMVNHSKCLE